MFELIILAYYFSICFCKLSLISQKTTASWHLFLSSSGAVQSTRELNWLICYQVRRLPKATCLHCAPLLASSPSHQLPSVLWESACPVTWVLRWESARTFTVLHLPHTGQGIHVHICSAGFYHLANEYAMKLVKYLQLSPNLPLWDAMVETQSLQGLWWYRAQRNSAHPLQCKLCWYTVFS